MEEWGNVRTRRAKAQTLAITSPLMRFTSGHADAPSKPAEGNPTATRYSDQRALTFTRKCLRILNLLSGLMNI